jgi:cytochrome P450
MITDTASEVPYLDILQPGFAFEGPQITAARQANWFARSPIGPVALRHQEVSELLRDCRFRLGGEAYMAMHGIDNGPLHNWWMQTLMSLEGRTHQRLRSLVGKAFTPAMVEGVRSFTRATAARLADALTPSAEHDFIRDFADPLPALVMCEILGVPPADYAQFHQWVGDIGIAFATGGLTVDVICRVDQAIQNMGSYIKTLIARRRHDPGPDLLSAMISAQVNGASLSEAELHDMALLLVWAGQDTTSRQLGRALVALSQNPGQWALLRQHPSAAGAAADESLRWTPQARMIQRYAMQDLTYRDLHLAAGDVLFCCIVSANRDPLVFPAPDEFDIRRSQPSRQLAFGGGPHHCLGHALARLELTEALAALAERRGTPSVCGPITWRDDLAMIHGPDVLPLRFAET